MLSQFTSSAKSGNKYNGTQYLQYNICLRKGMCRNAETGIIEIQ